MIKLNIYIIHCSNLNDRESNIDKLKDLSKNQELMNVDICTVSDHNASTLQMKNIKNLIKLGKLDDGENEFYNQFTKQLSLEFISNNFNHFKALQHVSKNDDTDFNLIVEDDIQFSDKIFSQIHTLILKLQTMEYDIVLLGQPSNNKQASDNLICERIDNKDLLLNCIDSFIISTQCAKNTLTNFFPIRYVQNVQLSYLINKNNLKSFKIFPNICGDGSKMGVYPSSVSANNVQIFNDTYKRIYLLLNDEENFNTDSIEKIKILIKENPYKDNPDFMHLEALLYKKIKDYNKSKELFEKTFDSYKEKNCIMNNTSIFMRNYIDLYKSLQ